MNGRLPPSFAMGPGAALLDRQPHIRKKKTKKPVIDVEEEEEEESEDEWVREEESDHLDEWLEYWKEEETALNHGKQEEEAVEKEEGRVGGVDWSYRARREKSGVKDSEQIRKIIFEAQESSKHFKNEQRKGKLTEERIARLLERKAKAEKEATAESIQKERKEIVNCTVFLESQRDFQRTWIHIDMDAFYAAVEERENPALKSVPLAIGGMALLTTCNYIARSYGIGTPCSGVVAKKLCPDLVILKGNHKLYNQYNQVSKEMASICREYDPDVEQTSLDECYLDVTEYLAGHPEMSVEGLVTELRQRIEEKTKLTASAGAGPNPRLAKMLGEINKPNGQYVIPFDRDAILRFLHPIRAKKVPGIGRVTAQVLSALGMHTCGDLLQEDHILTVFRVFSKGTSLGLLRAALGVYPARRDVVDANGEGRVSIGHQSTFHTTREAPTLEQHTQRIAKMVAKDLKKRNLEGRQLVVGVKNKDFLLRTRSVHLQKHISDEEELFVAAWKVVLMFLGEDIRLISIRVSNLRNIGQQVDVDGQRTIASFFSKSHEESEPPTCPLCELVLDGMGNDEVNAHVDQCLGMQDSKHTLPREQKRKRKKVKNIQEFFQRGIRG